MVLEYNCWKPLSTSNGFPRQNVFGIPVRWWWWMTVLMMRLEILETISTTKWVWSTTHGNHFHNKMVLAFRDGDDDERRCWLWDWRFQWWWWWRRWWFNLFPRLFCFVLFGFLWGCKKQLCWNLCTVHKDFLMHHNRSPGERVKYVLFYIKGKFGSLCKMLG